MFWRGGKGGAFGPGGNDGSHRLDTVAMPACVGALPTNGRFPACERPCLHEGRLGGAVRVGGVFYRSGETGSRRMDTVTMPACVGALLTNGRSLV